jgi:hypothetical protein
MRPAVAFLIAGLLLAPAMARQQPSAVPAAPDAADALRRVHDDETDRLLALERKHLTWAEDNARFEDAARAAWAFVARRGQTSTGLMSPIGNYPYATTWDIASSLAALYTGRELGLLRDEAYHARMQKILATLRRMPLHDNAVFNKSYDTRTGGMVPQGRGWSTTDVGRLLIWLRIVGADPRFAAAADAIARRNDFTRVVKDGYLWGETVDGQGRTQRYQEGRIGYEQYAAHGFALWGFRAGKALRLHENALPVTVLRQPLVADRRRSDRLMNEPFLLQGLELGWDRETRALVRHLLLVQEARYRKTGLITITGEDAIDLPPHFFYYYCVLADGKAFGVDVQDPNAIVDGPRWISAKSAYAFHALMPTAYTRLAVEAVAGARRPDGWTSGVFEGTGHSTGSQTINLNTAAVILTAAVVNRRGRALLDERHPPAR